MSNGKDLEQHILRVQVRPAGVGFGCSVCARAQILKKLWGKFLPVVSFPTLDKCQSHYLQIYHLRRGMWPHCKKQRKALYPCVYSS